MFFLNLKKKSKKLKFWTVFYLIFGLNLSFPFSALAKVNISENFAPAKTFSSLGSIISVLLPNIYIIAGVILLILLIFGGLSFIMNAGKGDSKSAEQGKQMLTWAIVGFIVIFASYWLIQIIEFITGVNILNPGEIGL